MTEPFKAHIRSLCEDYRALVGAVEYDMQILFIDETPLDEDRLCATIRVDPEYLDLVVKIYPRTYDYWEVKDYFHIADTVLHEFCHVLTSPLFREAEKAVSLLTRGYLDEIHERQTQRTCNALFSLLPKSSWMPARVKS